jgi:hypothetical protein
MKNKNLMIIGGIALAIGGYMLYKKYGKTEGGEGTSNFTDEYNYAKGGTSCKCANGVTGYCGSGDCNKCCGDYGVDKPTPANRNSIFREAPYKRSGNEILREAPYRRF